MTTYDVAQILLVLGSILCLSGGAGILRFPDFFSRLHACGVTDTLGATLILGGLMLMSGEPIPITKLVLILLFLLITGPTAIHALAKSALAIGEVKHIDDDIRIAKDRGGQT